MNAQIEKPVLTEKEQSGLTTMHIVYALMALGFFTGLTWIIAVIICYVKRDDFGDSFLGSHASWNIKTFWWTLGLGILFALLVMIVVGIPLLFALTIWVIYRIVKGWLRLADREAID